MSRGDSQQDLFIDAPLWYKGLTGKRRLFVEYYCTDKSCIFNAQAAYIKAYGCGDKTPADGSVQSNASRMMRDSKIKNAIDKLLKSRQNEEDKLSEFQVLELLKQLTFYNPKDIIDEYGNIKGSLEELGPLALCVTGVKKSRHGKEIKLYDRSKSLAVLCNYLNITRPVEGTTIINPVVCLTEKDIEAIREEEARAVKGSAHEAHEADYEEMEDYEDE